MKKTLSLVLLVIVALCVTAGAALAADAAATATVSPAAAVEWLMANKAIVFGAALALSELLALIPGLKGNGILDIFIKTLRRLAGKETA